MKLALLGDLGLVGKYDVGNSQKLEEAKKSLEYLRDQLKEFDYVVANLETPVTGVKKSIMPKTVRLKTSLESIELLLYLGIDAVSLANNHIYDFGRRGLNDTITTLEKNNIEWFGVNNKTLHKQFGDTQICFSGFCCLSTNGLRLGKEINLLALDKVKEQLTKDKAAGEFSVLSAHWGLEHTYYPSYDQLVIARKIFELNDCIICGHHPHIIQGINMKDNKHCVLYSLGNCVFDHVHTPKIDVPLNTTNQESFVAVFELQNNTIMSADQSGFEFKSSAYKSMKLVDKLKEVSRPLNAVKSVMDYEDIRVVRENEFKKVILEKFGKRDLKWVVKKLNYFDLSNFILSKFRSKKYKRVMEEFNE